MDPFGQFGDAELWAALEASSLAAVVGSQEGELESVVVEGGSNWSTGERQLLCMARCMLRGASTRVLVLDEATSSIDPITEVAIQAAVNALCSTTNCTLLAIAHRLDTVIDMDQILVMADGEVAEYGTPQELLRVPGGAFAALAARAGVGFPQTRIVSMQSS